MTKAAIVPPLMRPCATSTVACHIIIVIPPKIKEMTIMVISARTMIRRRAVPKAASTALRKRLPSRCSWEKAWTMRIAPSVSATIVPTSAMRSWLLRERFRTRRPSSTIGTITNGIPTSRPSVSIGASVNR
jgi:hypothetical protein